MELPQICDLAAAAKVHAAMCDLSESSNLLIDASRVERCGTAIAQILVAASIDLEGQGNRLVISSMSDQFKMSLQDLGLGDCLCSWE
ncbi:STAS domain-containing protein [Labrenzia sp. CE80]|uniref:STAS domain-containing protein n=1 Tax=Labrenzia sp. CE80 TaxID=1788986 RepID=UPI002570E9F6|nr:STAS domain-containing protein [Labrenzia sp. CE80]